MPSVPTMKGARYIAEAAQAAGIDHVFFVDAVLRRALVEMEDVGIRRVLARSEKAAAYMADGYSRAARRPALCMAQAVGAANLAAGLQDAWLGQSSVVALTGRKPPFEQYRNSYQEIPHEPLFSAVTKMTARVDLPEQLPQLFRQAFRTATTGRPGPAHLDINGMTGDTTALLDCPGAAMPEPAFARVPAYRPPADPEMLRQAAAAIDGASRPVLVVGLGAMVSQAEAAIVALAERLSAPVVAALDAKAVMVDQHPLNGGIVGTYSRKCANRIVAEADLVIFVGCDTGDQVTSNWVLPMPGTPVVQIDPDPAELGRSYPGTIGVQADVRTGVEQLAAMVAARPAGAWAARAQALVAEWRAETAPALAAGTGPIRPERLCAELTRVLPADALLVADTGYSSQWSGTLVELRHPGQGYMRAAGSLGWGFPGALGAKCALPGRPVVCFTGDGGFMYHMAELETARRCGIHTITVVNNNGCLAQGARSIDAAYEGRNGNKNEIYVFHPMNFARIAQSMDCFGVRVEKASDFAAAFAEAEASGRPAVIDVATDPEARAPLGWTP
ncbi:acetolactate synthase-1/2/3 large subunit [Stella humosa]|uniref:Acetolactate synthase-1/2/3 large subunit n=1 Tax=Stella humosa TaxID=94 RepID=A0A3N1LHN6_9PROT|nr:thiamine pyrophosphate-binding protein [Stella humosa]ROP90760.1 acetolactate synthase-1/2/3 large subunit [Stella humosa]BBK34894.1 acetolactate synthase [Stella humosa]